MSSRIELNVSKSVGRLFAVLVVEDADKLFKKEDRKFIPNYAIEDFKQYCMFCAHEYWVFNDELEQVVMAPSKMWITAFDGTSLAWRCQHCRMKKKTESFDNREIMKPERLTIAESSMDRPMLWLFERDRPRNLKGV